MTQKTTFVVQYELYRLKSWGRGLAKDWVDGGTFDKYREAVYAMGEYMRDHANYRVAYKYGKHRIVRRTTTVIDESICIPEPDENPDRVSLATPLKMVQDRLSTRLYNVLHNNTPHTHVGPMLLAHIVVCDAQFWAKQWGMGPVKMAELEAFLRDNNLPELGTISIGEMSCL